jgi:hypothetical protein
MMDTPTCEMEATQHHLTYSPELPVTDFEKYETFVKVSFFFVKYYEPQTLTVSIFLYIQVIIFYILMI